MKEHGKNQKIVLTALMAALTYAATVVIRIPTPTGGYVNLGDAVVLLSAFLLGPVAGMLAGGIGSALSDLMAGYMAWVPATLVIKGAMGLVAGLLYRKLAHNKVGIILAAIPAECIMVLGYFVFEIMLLGSVGGAAAGIIPNVFQAVAGIVAGTLLTMALQRNSYVRKHFPSL